MGTHDGDKAAQSPLLPSQLPADMPTSSFAEMSDLGTKEEESGSCLLPLKLLATLKNRKLTCGFLVIFHLFVFPFQGGRGLLYALLWAASVWRIHSAISEDQPPQAPISPAPRTPIPRARLQNAPLCPVFCLLGGTTKFRIITVGRMMLPLPFFLYFNNYILVLFWK